MSVELGELVDGEVAVEVQPGNVTPEQRAALERFRRWYAAKIVGDLSRGAGVESATPFDQDPEGGG